MTGAHHWLLNQISSIKFSIFQGNLIEENILYQQLQKICREKVCGMKVFRVNLGKIAPQKLPAHTPMMFRTLFENRQALRIR